MPARSKKSSPSRAASARTNGRKSRGPKTAAGKAKSSRNSLKHGGRCSSRTPLLLPGEDAAKLQLYTDAYYQHFCPQDLAEASLVDTMIAQVWKAARIIGYEAEMLTSSAEDLHPKLSTEYASIDATRLFALAFEQSSEEGKNPLPLRYLVSTRNMFRSALADLIRMRQAKGNPQQAFIQPPKILPNITNFCIDPEVLPVTGLGDVTHHTAPFAEDAPPAPEPEVSFHPPEAFTYTPPTAEPQTHYAPPDPPAPPPEPAVDEQPQEAWLSQFPMLPMRDKQTNAILINAQGKPIWTPNHRYIPRPGVTPPLFPFAGETFDFGLFPEKFMIHSMLHQGLFHDDVRMNEELFPIEPKPPQTEKQPSTSATRHPHKMTK